MQGEGIIDRTICSFISQCSFAIKVMQSSIIVSHPAMREHGIIHYFIIYFGHYTKTQNTRQTSSMMSCSSTMLMLN